MPTLNRPQAEFLSMPHKFKAYVAGFGSGKSWAGCAGIVRHHLQWPKVNSAYYAPTYRHIRDIFYPTIDEVTQDWGLTIKVKKADQEVDLYLSKKYIGTVICRSLDSPENIIGYKTGHAVIDELDVLKQEKAQLAWRKIMARMRYKVAGLRNGIDVTTTPEGFRFTYSQFVQQLREKPELVSMYGIKQASTYDNEANLPDDYIPSLLSTYPENLISAYINGEFTNLTTGTIYHQFDRVLNNSQETLSKTETLFIGMDFNVGKMSAIIHVKRGDTVHAVDEIINAYDTPDIIRIIKERYYLFENNNYIKSRDIRIYPDSSGGGRKSVNATETDIQLLRQAGFSVLAKPTNPPVKDRINAVNAMFCNAKNERRYFVNVIRCPTLSDFLEQQVWDKNGEPDKSSGKDHANDAMGYFIYYDYPLSKPVFKTSLRSIV